MKSFPQHISAFLSSHFIADVSTVNKEGEPHLTMVYYATNESDNGKEIIFLSKEDSQKVQNLKNNNRLAMMIMNLDQMKTLELLGDAEVVDEEKEVYAWTKTITQKVESLHDGWLPLLQTEGTKIVLVRFVPRDWNWSNYGG